MRREKKKNKKRIKKESWKASAPSPANENREEAEKSTYFSYAMKDIGALGLQRELEKKREKKE